MKGVLAFGIALIGIGYLIIQFGALVLEDLTIARETGEGPERDAETARWLEELKQPVEVTPADSSSLDDLLIDLMTSDLQLRGHVPAQRRPGDVS